MLFPNELVYASDGNAFLARLFCSPSRAQVVMCDCRWNISMVVEKGLVLSYLYDS